MTVLTDIVALESLKAFLEEHVAKEILLMPAQDNNVHNYALVHPTVHLGYVPPAKLLPQGTEHVIPCILVGMESGEDTGTDASLSIKLTFVIYNPGRYGENGLSPDFSGYVDLLNLMGLVRQKLLARMSINKTTIIQKPINWGLYDEPPYPYWYGYMTFSVSVTSIQYTADIEQIYE